MNFKQTVSFILLAVMFVSGQDKGAASPPKTAPQVYVSHKFGLMVMVPDVSNLIPSTWALSELPDDRATVTPIPTPTTMSRQIDCMTSRR